MPTWRDLERFCKHDDWEKCNPTKKADHDYYRKIMPDGTIKRTKVSRGTGEIGKVLFKYILKDQLQVDYEYFNKKYNKKSQSIIDWLFVCLEYTLKTPKWTE